MATVNICDRCGAFGKQEVMCGIGINAGRDRNNLEIDYKSYEVCAVCRAEFDEWMAMSTNRAGASVKDKYQGEVQVDPKQVAMMKVAAREYAQAQADMARAAKKSLTDGSEST